MLLGLLRKSRVKILVNKLLKRLELIVLILMKDGLSRNLEISIGLNIMGLNLFLNLTGVNMKWFQSKWLLAAVLLTISGLASAGVIDSDNLQFVCFGV